MLPIADIPVDNVLVVLQSTSFCNIACKYCYLADKEVKTRMSLDTVRAIARDLRESELCANGISVVWHAGEPMVLPMDYYADAIAIIDAEFPDVPRRYNFQTNGTLITEALCEFIKCHGIKMGLSVDGPATIHDRNRLTRAGRGTHAKVVAGMEMLQAHGIDYHVIAVLSSDSLDMADEIYDFFVEHRVREVSFNIEEVEGVHQNSSMTAAQEAKVRTFYERLLLRNSQSDFKLEIRELAHAMGSLARGPTANAFDNTLIRPLGIVSYGVNGEISCFSPELLGVTSATHDSFVFGNVHEGGLGSVLRDMRFKRVFAEIMAGVNLCAESCSMFGYCGGGAPSNKLFENGSFASGETLYCRYGIKIPVDIAAEHALKLGGAMEPALG